MICYPPATTTNFAPPVLLRPNTSSTPWPSRICPAPEHCRRGWCGRCTFFERAVINVPCSTQLNVPAVESGRLHALSQQNVNPDCILICCSIQTQLLMAAYLTKQSCEPFLCRHKVVTLALLLARDCVGKAPDPPSMHPSTRPALNERGSTSAGPRRGRHPAPQQPTQTTRTDG